MTLLTTEQAAEIIGVSAHEVRRLCRAGLLPATRVGPTWVLETRVVETYRRRQRGSPKRPEAPG